VNVHKTHIEVTYILAYDKCSCQVYERLVIPFILFMLVENVLVDCICLSLCMYLCIQLYVYYISCLLMNVLYVYHAVYHNLLKQRGCYMIQLEAL